MVILCIKKIFLIQNYHLDVCFKLNYLKKSFLVKTQDKCPGDVTEF